MQPKNGKRCVLVQVRLYWDKINMSKNSHPDNSCIYLFYFIADLQYSIDVELIPRSHRNRCPIGSKYRARFGVCSCNRHCSWDLCRTIDPPNDCLAGTGSVWRWDQVKNAWVAQIDGGNKLSRNQ